MKYFLTGATGFIGGRLARRLREIGHEVIALVRDPAKAANLRDLGVTLVPGDITEKATILPGMKGVDGVFHVAAWYKIGEEASLAEKVNVGGTRNVLEAMRDLHIPKGVYTSTLAVFSDTKGAIPDETYRYDGPHLSPYDRTKWQAHYEVALPLVQAGLPLVIVQPGVVYGPGDHSAVGEAFRQYLRRRLPVIPAETTFCWAHVDDVVQGHILAMMQGTPGETYIIAGACHTMAEAFGIATDITGLPLPRLIPPKLLGKMASVMGVLEKVVKVPSSYTAEALRVSAGTTYMGDNTKARRDLGYRPRPLREGLAETLPALAAEEGVTLRMR